mgnify:CR=1 FL=1
MIRVLFICHGNICRSPMAELFRKKLVSDANLADHFQIASAATSTEEIWNGIGNPVYPPAKAELARHGISCEGKRARQVTRADYAEYDYLIGMDGANIPITLRGLGGGRHAADIRGRSGGESNEATFLCGIGTGYFGSMVYGRFWNDLR